MARLTAARRRALPARDFAGPGRSYPIDTRARAQVALGRSTEDGDSALKAAVRRHVKAKYPGMKVKGGR